MSVKIYETNVQYYGKCLKIENEICSLCVTLDLGPRIISYNLKNFPNLLFNDISDQINNYGDDFDNYFYKNAKWHLYGGHRLWVAPEKSPNTYYPDNNPVKYVIEGNKVIFTQEKQTSNNIQLKIELELSEKSSNVKLTHYVQNLNEFEIEISPWALTVMAPNGVQIIPQNTNDTGLLPNRILSLWSYSNPRDNRLHLGENYITIKQDISSNTSFKIGVNCENKWSCYLLDNQMFIKNFDYQQNQKYPDFGVNLETYTSDKILEIETLAPLTKLKYNQVVCHIENWNIKEVNGNLDYKNDKTIEKFVNQNIK